MRTPMTVMEGAFSTLTPPDGSKGRIDKVGVSSESRGLPSNGSGGKSLQAQGGIRLNLKVSQAAGGRALFLPLVRIFGVL